MIFFCFFLNLLRTTKPPPSATLLIFLFDPPLLPPFEVASAPFLPPPPFHAPPPTVNNAKYINEQKKDSNFFFRERENFLAASLLFPSSIEKRIASSSLSIYLSRALAPPLSLQKERSQLNPTRYGRRPEAARRGLRDGLDSIRAASRSGCRAVAAAGRRRPASTGPVTRHGG